MRTNGATISTAIHEISHHIHKNGIASVLRIRFMSAISTLNIIFLRKIKTVVVSQHINKVFVRCFTFLCIITFNH